MANPVSGEITTLLQDWSEGDKDALEMLIPLVKRELHRTAQKYLRKERQDHILQPTALVNEAFLRLINNQNIKWQNRAHFFAVSAQIMRRILVDIARRYSRMTQVEFDESLPVSDRRSSDLIALDDALLALAEIDERKSRIVELRYFGGLSVAETAEVLEISTRTVEREWNVAQAWLYRELSGGHQDEA